MNASRILALSLVVLLVAAAAMAQNINNTGTFTNTGTASYNNFTNAASGTVTNTGTLRIRGTLTNSAVDANFDTEAGTLNYYGLNSPQTIISNIKNNKYGNLGAMRGGTKSLGGNVTVGTAVTVNNLTGTGTVLAVGTKYLTLQGTGTPINIVSGTVSSSATGTIDYAGGAATVASGFDYGNLVFSTAAGNRTFQAGTTGITGGFTISAGAADARTNATTIDYKGTGAQNVAAIDYNNLSFSTSGTKSFAAGTTRINGSLTIGGTAAADARTNTSTVEYDGTAQNIAAINYYNVTLANSGTKTFASGTTKVSNTFDITGTAVPNLTANSTVFEYDGASQSVRGGVTYYDFVTSNSGTKTLTGGNLTISNNFDNGGAGNNAVTLNVGTSTLTLGGGTSDNTNGTIQFAGATNGLAFGTGTVEYNAAALAQTVTAGTYAKLTLTGGGTATPKSILASMTTTDLVTVNSDAKLIVNANPVSFGTSLGSGNSLVNAGTLEVQAAGNLTVTADVSNSGTITNAGTITVGAE